jgi:hypothetical protein
MKNRLIATTLISFAVLLTGCATRTKMAFENDSDKITATSKPIYLMTATIKNTYKTSYQPRLLVVNVEKPNAKDASGRLNFTMDSKARNETDKVETGNSYLLRMELEAGNYEIKGLTSMASSFPFHGLYFAPMHSQVQSTTSGVYYLGHVEATVRERKGNEFKAGPSIPLIDQAVAGASGGTFDIVISDQLTTDEPRFREKFPALAGVEIKKAVLPAFDRDKAQAWWEAH